MDKNPSFKLSPAAIQATAWVVFALFLFFYSANKWVEEPEYALLNALIAVCSYLPAVYGNALYFWPRFFQKGKLAIYILLSVVFIALIVVCRMAAEYWLLLPVHKVFYDWNVSHLSLATITITLAYIFGGMLRIAINYNNLSRKQAEIEKRETDAQLNLLKSQVQPHFLFNTLNNIYSLAQSKSDKTAEMIAKLSELMRYFVDDMPKEKVPVSYELHFIKSYVELEQIRMINPVKMNFNINADAEKLLIPPMLLMPFIENVFKHGVDKTQKENSVQIDLIADEKFLHYTVKNSCYEKENDQPKGSGLYNLEKRLELLYNKSYHLTTKKNGSNFIAEMKIPIQ